LFGEDDGDIIAGENAGDNVSENLGENIGENVSENVCEKITTGVIPVLYVLRRSVNWEPTDWEPNRERRTITS